MQKIRIAIYGLGVETKNQLPKLKEQYEIIGLLDGFKTTGEMFGYPILPFEAVVEAGVKLIIVIARPGSCRAIAKRIGNQCKDANIKLIDIRNNDLLEDKRVTYSLDGLNSYTKDMLFYEVLKYDVISFDLFDTLIMRKVLHSSDVLEFLFRRLTQKGIVIENFIEKRIASEKMLAVNSVPTLIEIYENMIRENKISNVTAEQLAEEEFECDISLVVPRYEMITFINEVRTNKKICIVTDTYYSKYQIEKILLKCNIVGCFDVFISCEYKTDKSRDLFDHLKNSVVNRNILHIGDDIQADIESAKRHNLDAFKIYSAAEFWDHQAIVDSYSKDYSFAERLKLGLFVSKVFNSPFQFESNGEIKINKSCDIGYLFFAPMILDFVIWMREQCEKNNNTDILLSARDGYLIRKIFEMIGSNINTVYFYTSRLSAIRAGVADVSDIAYVNSMRFSGKLSEQLYTRFGLTLEDVDENQELFSYKDEILNNANMCRQNYMKYINKIEFSGDDIAFFDFVAKGTCQFFVERICKKKMKGYYFLRLEENELDKLDVETFYTNKDNVIYNEYYILETILTSPEPSVNGFNEMGEVVFAKETRSNKDIQCFIKIQEGILSYVADFLEYCPIAELKVSKEFDELFLTLIHKYQIKNVDFLNMNVEDPFFNRDTNLSNLV